MLYDRLSDRFFAVEGEWSMRKCRDAQCGLIWLDPAIYEQDIAALYANYYTHHEGTRRMDWLRRLHNAMVDIYTRERFGLGSRTLSPVAWIFERIHPAGAAELQHAALHLPSIKMGQRLLDVGTGSAKHLPRLVKIGLQVEGIEPDPAAAESARRRGLNITVGDFMRHSYPDSSFDFVTMSHVIEHVHDPLGAFRKAFDVLAPSGRLVALTPNVASRGHRRFGRNWSMLDAPRHLTLFNAQTIAILARKAGFVVDELRTTVCYAREVFVVSSRLGTASESPPTLILGVKDSLRGIPYQLRERFRQHGEGEELVLVARKPV